MMEMKLCGRVLIGLSGGADSMALAHLLLQKRAAGEIDLCAVHVNHGLRGEESDGDEAFVQAMCRRWQLPLKTYHLSPPDNPSEEWARQARYDCFRQALEHFGADVVALAHHQDDQAETLLLHLLRGAGLKGLSGMAERGEVLGVPVVRPLLSCPRRELQAMLERAGIPWREDSSNQDNRYLRNALRHQLLPMLEQLAPGAGARIAAASDLLREDDAALEQAAEAFLQANGGEDYLPKAALKQLPTGLVRRVLRLWWQRYAGSGMQEHALSRQQTEALLTLLDAPTGSKCNLPGGYHGYVGWQCLHLVGKPIHMADCTMAVIHDMSNAPGDGLHTQVYPAQKLAGCEVRTRRLGDWICPYGMEKAVSLQDYLVNKRVDAPFRDRLPLLCRGSEVLMIPGVGSGGITPMEECTDPVIVCWTGCMPWTQK